MLEIYTNGTYAKTGLRWHTNKHHYKQSQMPYLTSPCRRARRNTQKIKFWFTQFGVRTTKLRLQEDGEMGRAETGEEERRATPNYAQTLSNFVQSLFTHYRAQGKVNLHKCRP
jgi:hypothetical protein